MSVWDDLPTEPAAEALRIPSPAPLVALAGLLRGGAERAVAPLRDATCRSFPVWAFDPEFSRALADLPDSALDGVAQEWLADASCAELDADAYELSTLLTDLRQALGERSDPAQQLFVLLEEKAL